MPVTQRPRTSEQKEKLASDTPERRFAPLQAIVGLAWIAKAKIEHIIGMKSRAPNQSLRDGSGQEFMVEELEPRVVLSGTPLINPPEHPEGTVPTAAEIQFVADTNPDGFSSSLETTECARRAVQVIQSQIETLRRTLNDNEEHLENINAQTLSSEQQLKSLQAERSSLQQREAELKEQLSALAPVSLIEDNFDAGLDASIWTTKRPGWGSSVTARSGRIDFRGRGYLVTKQEFDPSVLGQLQLSGDWTFRPGRKDFMQILTRSDAQTQGRYGETRSGIEFFATPYGEVSILVREGRKVTNIARGEMKIGTNKPYHFEMTDDGHTVTFTFEEVGNSGNKVTLTAESDLSTERNHIVFHNREWWARSSVDNVRLAVQPLSVEAAKRTSIIQDDFSNGIDSSVWDINNRTTRIGRPNVFASNGHVEMRGRGYLVTREEFDPDVTSPLHVSGDWTFRPGRTDFMQVLTRSDGKPQGGYGETRSGIEFFATPYGEVSIFAREGGKMTSLARGEMDIRTNKTYHFEITDDGHAVTFTLEEVSNSNNKLTITAKSDLRTGHNHAVFHNREHSRSELDNVEIGVEEKETPMDAVRRLEGEIEQAASACAVIDQQSELIRTRLHDLAIEEFGVEEDRQTLIERKEDIEVLLSVVQDRLTQLEEVVAITPEIRIAKIEGPNVLVVIQSSHDQSSVAFDRSGMFSSQKVEHEGGTTFSLANITINGELKSGQYRITLSDRSTILDTVTVRWDQPSKTLSLVNPEDEWTPTNYVDASGDLSSQVTQDLKREAVEFERQSLLPDIDIGNTELKNIQRLHLYRTSNLFISAESMINDYFFKARPQYHPDNIIAYIQEEQARNGTYSPGAIESRIQKKKLDLMGDYTRSLGHYENIVSGILQLAVDVIVGVKNGEPQWDLTNTLNNAINFWRTNRYIGELGAIGIRIPDKQTFINEARRIYEEQFEYLVRNQCEEARLIEKGNRIASDREWQISQGQPDLTILTKPDVSATRRLGRAQRLMEIAFGHLTDSRVQVTVAQRGEPNMQRMRELGNGRTEVILYADEAEQIARNVEDAIKYEVDAERVGEVVSSYLVAKAENVVVDAAGGETEMLEFGNRIDGYLKEHMESLLEAVKDGLRQNPDADPWKLMSSRLVANVAAELQSGDSSTWNEAMINIELEKVRKKILNGYFGVGYETVRILTDATIDVGEHTFLKLYVKVKRLQLKVHLEDAASRGGAQIDGEIAAYHQQLIEDQIFTMSDSLSNGPGGKPLLVLVMGNRQKISAETGNEDAGIKEIYSRLQQKFDVILFRVGRAWNEVKDMVNLSFDYSLHTSVVQQHMENVLEDIAKMRGLFAGKTAPTKIVFGGYSFGGGAIEEAMKHWGEIGNGIEVAGTSYIDGVRLGVDDLGRGINERPQYSNEHLHIWQDNNNPLRIITGGAPMHGHSLGYTLVDKGPYREGVSTPDRVREIYIEDTNHVHIDDDPFVLDALQKYLEKLLTK